MAVIDSRIDHLEDASVQTLIEYLENRDPQKNLIDKARIAQGAFASVQRRRSAENQRDALLYMMQRDGLSRPQRLTDSQRGKTSS